MHAELPDAERGTDELDRAIARFERLSVDLVLLEPIGREQLVGELTRFTRTVRGHLAGVPPTDPGGRAEHRRFEESLEVLGWLEAIVEEDDHGGNRQALGQYGKLLTEALRAHRSQELRGSLPVSGRTDRAPEGQP